MHNLPNVRVGTRAHENPGMPFTRGSVSYARFRIAGDSPARADDTVLDALRANVLQPTIGVPVESESGWTAGDHILDQEFSREHCVYGDCLHAAMRLDRVRVPSELKRAYLAQEHRAAMLARTDQGEVAGLPTRPLGRHERREAKEAAERRWLEEVSDGRHRSSALVPILWNLGHGSLLAPANGDKVVDALRDLVQTTFGGRLKPASAGSVALDVLAAKGLSSRFDDAVPDAFGEPPTPRTAELAAMVGDRPDVPWAQGGPEPKDFLGNVFLIWLWMRSEQREAMIDLSDGRGVSLVVDRTIDMECAWGVTGRQSLRGDAPGRSAEAAKALQQGKWPRRLGLILSDGHQEWSLDLQGDLFRVGGLKIPKPEEQPGSEREAVELRIDSIQTIDGILLALYEQFLHERFADGWPTRRAEIAAWIAGKGRRPAPASSVVEMSVG